MEGQFDDVPEVAESTSLARKSGVTVISAASVVKFTLSSTSCAAAAPASSALALEDEGEEVYNDDHGAFDLGGDVEYEDLAGLEAAMLGEKGGLGGSLGSTLERNLATGKMNLSQRIANNIESSDRVAVKQNHTGRDDRATSEQVMDPRTRLMLFKLLNSGFLSEIDGCLSTGKEANVYYGKAGPKGEAAVARGGTGAFKEFAIKVFKTSILVFKDRDKYVSGEFRFRNGYCRSNPRKMVKTWAEKELRNYRRLHAAGIPSPEPVLLKNHILIMEFVGADGW